MTELDLLRKLEVLLRGSRDELLTRTIMEDCNCPGKGKRPKKVFRVPAAFEINMILEQLDQFRSGNTR